MPLERCMRHSSPTLLSLEDSAQMRTLQCFTTLRSIMLQRGCLRAILKQQLINSEDQPILCMFIPIGESNISAAKLTHSQKWQAILDSCQRAQTIQVTSHSHTKSKLAQFPRPPYTRRTRHHHLYWNINRS